MTTFNITKVYTSKGGSPYTPMIGEWYTLTAEFTVTGTARNAYTVGFTMADRYVSVPMADKTPGSKKLHADFFLALDDEIPWLVEVDPFKMADADDPTKSWIPHHFPDPVGNGGNQMRKLTLQLSDSRLRLVGIASRKGKFIPNPPPNAIDFYDPHWLVATQGSFTTFTGSKIDRLAIMMGAPTTDSWQKRLQAVCRVQWGGGDELLPLRPVEGPTMYQVFFFDQHNVPKNNFSMVHQAVLEVRNQRVDASLLRAVTWAQLDATQGIDIFKTYTSPEEVIESNHPKVADYVSQTLGANYRNHMTPYDAGRKLFKAVLARTHYFYPQPGQEDKRPPTAVGVIDAGLGDCGDFSMLLVALYRHIGFPSRTACGAWVGQDAGHCWCEMWYPGHGWMVSDGSIGNGACEDGSFAYYYGTCPDLNARYADMRGNTFQIGDIDASWLQGPSGPWLWGQISAVTDAHTAVIDVGESAAMSLVDSGNQHMQMSLMPSKPDQRSLAFQHCPCSSHGGFKPLRLRADLARKLVAKV